MEYNLIVNRKNKSVEAVVSQGRIKVETDNGQYDASFVRISDHQILLRVNGQNINAFVCNDAEGKDGDAKTVIIKGRCYDIRDADLMAQNGGSGAGKKGPANRFTVVASPMPAVVISVLAREGEMVEKGQGLVIVSAMKMETTLVAPYGGKVSGINAKEGDKVMPADILVDIERTEEGEKVKVEEVGEGGRV